MRKARKNGPNKFERARRIAATLTPLHDWDWERRDVVIAALIILGEYKLVGKLLTP